MQHRMVLNLAMLTGNQERRGVPRWIPKSGSDPYLARQPRGVYAMRALTLPRKVSGKTHARRGVPEGFAGW
jgi:hypothetical protein